MPFFGEIAAGGMATVHIGRLLGQPSLSRTVAIKRLHPQYAKDPEFSSMFLDEARVAARIQHPNVVATVDVVAEAGELFLVMEYVEGESLRAHSSTRARWSAAAAAVTAHRSCDTVELAPRTSCSTRSPRRGRSAARHHPSGRFAAERPRRNGRDRARPRLRRREGQPNRRASDARGSGEGQGRA